VRNALYLLEPEFASARWRPRLEARHRAAVQAEPVALEQIIHNLLTNALQALDQVPGQPRAGRQLSAAAGEGALTVGDSGPGIRRSAAAHLRALLHHAREGPRPRP
jgi:C4-dicarboxylate-specific signal transduction histidine kinase